MNPPYLFPPKGSKNSAKATDLQNQWLTGILKNNKRETGK
jgi:hypothetical protein